MVPFLILVEKLNCNSFCATLRCLVSDFKYLQSIKQAAVEVKNVLEQFETELFWNFGWEIFRFFKKFLKFQQMSAKGPLAFYHD